jgi:hypothetical protein
MHLNCSKIANDRWVMADLNLKCDSPEASNVPFKVMAYLIVILQLIIPFGIYWKLKN